jgi:autotransporter-associated beta strand protein
MKADSMCRSHSIVCLAAAIVAVTAACVAQAAVVTNDYSGTTTVNNNLVDNLPDLLAVRVVSGKVTFKGTNTYSGGTEVLNGATHVASAAARNTTSPLGSGSVTVRTNGVLQLDLDGLGGTSLTNNFYLNGGATLQVIGNASGNLLGGTVGNGVVYLGGPVNVIVTSANNNRSGLLIYSPLQDDGVNIGSLSVSNIYSGDQYGNHLRLYANNTYSGGTTVKAPYGKLDLFSTNALGSGPVTIESGGILQTMVATAVYTNAVSFTDGTGTLQAGGNRISPAGDIDSTTAWDGHITVAANATAKLQFWHSGFLRLNQNGGNITGAGSVTLGGNNTSGVAGHPRVELWGNNEYMGTTVIANCSWDTAVFASHSNAFGTAANTITVANLGFLYISANCPGGLHPNKAVRCGPNAYFGQAPRTVFNNALTLAGGTYYFRTPKGDWNGNVTATNSGAITLESGTSSSVHSKAAEGGNGGGHWYQTGTMGGSGALVLSGNGGTYDVYLHFRGNNVNYSGAMTNSGANTSREYRYAGSDNALGTGVYDMLGPNTNTVMLQLDANVTLPNAFTGTGKVSCTTYTLVHTGGLTPGRTNSTPKQIGALFFANTDAGKYDFRGTYNWKYNETTNDVVGVNTLTFGNVGGQAAVNASWIGAGNPPTPPTGGTVYTLFRYSGTAPTITTPWTVKAPGSQRGAVSVDAVNKVVILTLKPSSGGTVIMIR